MAAVPPYFYIAVNLPEPGAVTLTHNNAAVLFAFFCGELTFLDYSGCIC